MFCPKENKDQIDFCLIDKFVKIVVKSLSALNYLNPNGGLLDAGDGDCPHKPLFMEK